MTDEQGRTAGYRLSGRGLLYRDETGRERLAVVYWLTKLGTKTRWMLGLGVVGFIGLIILGAALDSANEEKTDTPASEAITEAPEVQEQDAITQQLEAAPTPEPTVGWSVRAVPGAVAEADDARVTTNQIVDPWFPNNRFMQPGAGKRYVAFDVTVQHTAGSGKLYTGASKFRLLNAEDFAYDSAGFCPMPCLDSIDLGGGQKTRGWVVFEVDEGTPLKVLKYDPQLFNTDDIEFYFR